MTRTLKVLSGAAALGALTLACGGGSGSPSAGDPGATPAPGVTPRPSPRPTPDPRIGLAPGPVTRYTIKVRTVNNGERDPVQDESGRWMLNRSDSPWYPAMKLFRQPVAGDWKTPLEQIAHELTQS